VPQTVRGGTRYSVHDHRFDFSQPEMACSRCHNAGEVDESASPPHEFNIGPVPIPENLTLEESCLRCHDDKDMGWVKENIGTLKYKL
jgi:cytochrome c553